MEHEIRSQKAIFLFKEKLLLLLLLLFPVILQAWPVQQATQTIITGRVTSAADNKALPGVAVVVKGTSVGTVSDENGEYSIEVADNDAVLSFSIIGFIGHEEAVNGRSVINVSLNVNVKSLREVVVVGYGTQTKENVTSAISSVSAEQLEQRPVASYDEALQGLIPGIEIAPRNARPGNVSAIKIRGIGSISGGFYPLFVVDGFPTDAVNANAINPADIQSIEVLKDASSTAIYGSRGANGVILITTKSGIKGKPKVNVNVSTGFAKVNKSDFYDVLNAEEYLQWYREKAGHNGTPVPDWVNNWDGTDTDWQSLIYRTAPYQNYSVSITGGSDKVNYYFSGSYIDQEGILLNQGFDKYSARAKVDFKPSDKITLGINVAPNFTVQRISAPDQDHASLTGAAIFLPPIIPAREEDGTPSDPNSYGIMTIPLANPLETAEKYKDRIKDNFLLANVYAQLEPIDGLKLKSTLGANVSNHRTRFFVPGIAGFGLPPATTLVLNSSQEVSWLNENTINYSRVFNNAHSVDLLAGFTAQKTTWENIHADANTFPSELGQTIGFGNTRNAGSGESGHSLLSYLARVNYAYKDKYLLTATIRRDGSSRFGTNKRWGVFPSISVGWNLANENFIKDNFDFVDLAKIRASYGTTGSNSIGDFTSRASLRTVSHSFGGSDVLGFVNADPGNPNLSWEVSRQSDIGFDLGLFRRFDLTFDYFNNETEELLLFVNVPPSTGYSGSLTNIGRMRNRGFELAINTTPIKRNDFTWDLGFNISNINQEVLELGPDQSRLYQFFGVLVTEIGGPLEQARGLKQIGILSQKDIDNGVARRPGDIAGDYKYLDANNDGFIDSFNQQDGVLLGDNNPNWIYGIHTSFKYKNFQLFALLNGQAGAEVFDFVYQIMSLHTYNTNMGQYFFDGRYISEAEPGNGSVPRAGYTDVGAVSSWEMQSTDFLRIRNVSLSYNFPKPLCDKLSLDNLRAYISVENLYTFTDFEGGNPSGTRFGNGRVVGDRRTLSLNSVPTPPLPRIYSLGLNFTF